MSNEKNNGQATGSQEDGYEENAYTDLQGAAEPENFTVGFHTEASGVFVLNIPTKDMYKAVELLNKFLNEAGIASFITKEDEEGQEG